jgi:hypothetical protein
MAPCARCGRPAQPGTRFCLACSAGSSAAGPTHAPAVARPYVQPSGRGARLPALAVAAPGIPGSWAAAAASTPTVPGRTGDQPTRRAVPGQPAPAAPGPARSGPARSGLAGSDPVARGQARPGPADSNPADSNPADSNPADSDPADSDHATQASKSQPANSWLSNPPNGRWTAITAAAAVVVIAAGAVTLVEHGRAPARAGGGPTGGATASPSASPGRTGGTSRPAPRPRPVTVAAAAASAPHAAAIAAFLTRYFAAIDHHSFGAYRSLFTPSGRTGLTAAAFTAGYGTTSDSHAVLHRISTAADGQIRAVVTFTSHQRASDSPTHTSCTTWSISLFLAKTSGRYVIETPPHDYKPSFRACS